MPQPFVQHVETIGFEYEISYLPHTAPFFGDSQPEISDVS